MTTKIDGTNGIVFPDSTTQSTAGIPSTSSQIAKAWVNFNGTGSVSSNQTIRASYNVAYVFKNATGDYTVNFTNAMSSANYATLVSGNPMASGNVVVPALYQYNTSTSGATTSSVRVIAQSTGGGGAVTDLPYFMVAVFA